MKVNPSKPGFLLYLYHYIAIALCVEDSMALNCVWKLVKLVKLVKTAFLGDTILDRLTSEGVGTRQGPRLT